MTQEENKLIGEFMGKSFKDPMNYMYDKSWDWLMPVIEKIEEVQTLSSVGMNVLIYNNITVIKCRRKGEVIATAKGKTRKQALYFAVIEFIKWYNQKPMKKIYLPIPIEAEKPPIGEDIFGLHDKDNWNSTVYLSDNGNFYNSLEPEDCPCYPTHWLKGITLPTEEEINKSATLSKESIEAIEGFIEGTNHILNLLK